MTKEKTKATHYECIKAETRFYTQGKVYKLVTNEQGHKGFIADDGLFDHKSLVTSSFKPVTIREEENS